MKLFTKFENIGNKNNKKEILKKGKIQKPTLLFFSLSFIFTNDDNDGDVVGSGLWGEVVVGGLGSEVKWRGSEGEVRGIGL